MQLERGHFIAIGATALLSVWMLSGLFSTQAETEKLAVVKPVTNDVFAVQVERYHAQSITPEIIIHGQTAPNRSVALTSELSGKVIKLHKREGDFVKKGQLIIDIDPQDKPQRLKMAQAQLKQRQLEHKANLKLVDQGLQNETQLAQSESQLAAAQAQVKSLQVQLDATQVRAPFSGILEDRKVELGTYLKSGNGIISLLDFNPFIIKAYAAEKDLLHIKQGSPAKGRTLDENMHKGFIRYVSSQANSASRTFAVELQIANPSERQNDGTTADILIPLGRTPAIFITPALLSLNEKGVMGAKYVAQDQQVVFAPVNLVKAESTGIWISGLPNPVDLIVVGQSFVSPGEKVRAVYKEPALNEGENTDQNLATHDAATSSAGK
jgi:multidrug efflux system membrane fusion protein